MPPQNLNFLISQLKGTPNVMLVVVSPAKNLDYETAPITHVHSQPELLTEAEKLIKVCKKLTPADLSSLMHISDKLAGLNVARFSSWSKPFTTDNAKQAVLAFNGDVYSGLDASSFSEADFDYAQSNLRILSGLYGLLKPLDLMQPYRLEMGTKLSNARGNNLYEFWGDRITAKLNTVLSEQADPILVNLASNEYFKSVKKKQLKGQLIEPVFKDQKNGQYKVISFFAKKARGLMTRFIIQNKVTTVAELIKFDGGGYQYHVAFSTPHQPVFTRDEA
jgi:cytoplasmic iron level regulating protein YaaA (DUF328/UPF0246 family)